MEDETILRIWPLLRSVQRPKPSAPQLFEMIVRSLTPLASRPAIRCSGLPERPKPPDMIVMPSKRTPASAASASGNILRLVIDPRSEEHTSELQSLMRISYAVLCLKKKTKDMNQQ